MEQVKNDKVFFHVFPTLKAEEDIQILFADVEVKKITTNSRRDFLRVHIFSRHLIQKKQIRQMEQRIKEQLFAKTPVNIQILEEYALSGQYTPEALLDEYRESIILELRESSMLAANMFAQAEIHYEEGSVVCLELLDTIVSEGRREEILNYLEKMFAERFHMKADIRISCRKPSGTGSREYDEQRIQQEINAIFERRARQRGETPETEKGKTVKDAELQSGAGEKGAAGSASGHSSGTGAGKGQARGGGTSEKGKKGFGKGGFKKKDFYRPVKTGDDPNLIYGRNFDDEPITLDQVITEMGEITFHGKIISFETREIRNEKTIIIFSVTDFTDTITVKMFARNDQLPEILGDLKKGAFVKVKGVSAIDKFDGVLTIGSVAGIKKIGVFSVSRNVLSPLKRV